jgi:hypothetical protein
LQTPTGLTAVNAGNKKIKLTWNAVPGATSYQLLRTNADGSNPTTITVSGSPYTDSSGLAPNANYIYRIRAVNGSAVSDWSGPVTGQA